MRLIKKISNDNDMKKVYFPYVHSFLINVFTIVDFESNKPKNFSAYKVKLEIIIEFIKEMNIDKMPALILDYLIDQFDAVSRYIGNKMGDAWEATDYWNSVKYEISKEKIKIILDRIEKINSENMYYISQKSIDLIKDVA